MDLKEAIIHTRQVADGCGADSRDCAYQHDKLGDWLEELQVYRSIGTVEELRALKEAEQMRREGVNKLLNPAGEYAAKFAENHGMSIADAMEQPMVKARFSFFADTGM